MGEHFALYTLHFVLCTLHREVVEVGEPGARAVVQEMVNWLPADIF